MEKEMTLVDVMQICAVKSQRILKKPWDQILPQYIQYVLCCSPDKYPLYFELVKAADSKDRFHQWAEEVRTTLDEIRERCREAIDSGEFEGMPEKDQ